MTRKKFEEIKAAGKAKWLEGKSQTEETYLDWWEETGRNCCSFCFNFYCEWAGMGEINCPLDDGHCAVEWYNIHNAHEYHFSLFLINATDLYDRIDGLKYEDLKQE